VVDQRRLKVLSPTVFEDTGLYANYAPASLYSNYSNYSELEALRSTDSQCSGRHRLLPVLDFNLGAYEILLYKISITLI
jgi:hypothetical protein